MDEEYEEKIIKFSKLIGGCGQEELNEMSSFSEEEWISAMEYEERGLSYHDWKLTIFAVSRMKEGCKNWLNEEEFWIYFNIS